MLKPLIFNFTVDTGYKKCPYNRDPLYKSANLYYYAKHIFSVKARWGLKNLNLVSVILLIPLS